MTGKERAPCPQEIYRNLHTRGHLTKYMMTWSTRDRTEAPDEHRARGAAWIECLRAGDVVAVMPRADFPGWRCMVHDAKIEIFTSVLSMKHGAGH